MNSFERVRAALSFGPVDRVPVIAQVFAHAGVLAGTSIHEYVRCGDILARCQLQALEYYEYDAVFAFMDVCVESEAMGSSLVYWPDQYPAVTSYAVTDDVDPDRITGPDPQHDGRMPEILKAVRLLRRELADDVLVIGAVLGPMTLVTQLLGPERALYMAIDQPDRFSRLLQFCVRVEIDFGRAQIEAGAHAILIFDPSSSPDVVPAQFFREFLLPHLQDLCAQLKAGGSVANWLHIAGPTDSILPYYLQIGVDIANFDYCVTAQAAQQALPHTCLDGNIRPLAFIEEEAENIATAAGRLLDSFAGRGGFILSSGCEIPPETKPENITAMVKAARV